LLPVSGAHGAVGQALANATTLALLDTNDTRLRITTYDTATGAAAATAQALADGNRLILGPVQADEVATVAKAAGAAHVPVISFGNDVPLSGTPGLLSMGGNPMQSVGRVLRYAHGQGATRFGALVPVGSYGERVSAAMIVAARANGVALVDMESYSGAKGTLAAAVRRLKAHGAMDAVLIGDTARVAAQAAPLLKAGAPKLRLLGTELWLGDGVLTQGPALSGAWFAALSDTYYRRFADSYAARFGAQPYRVATVGYDAVLLVSRVARDWKVGTPFPTGRLYDQEGFFGLDGAFRFGANGVVERSWNVMAVRAGSVVVASPAPDKFAQ